MNANDLEESMGFARRGRDMQADALFGNQMSGRTNDPRGYFFAAAGARPEAQRAPANPAVMMGNGQNGQNGQGGNGNRENEMARVMQFVDAPVRDRSQENARLQRMLMDLSQPVATRKNAEAALQRNQQQSQAEMQDRQQGRDVFGSIMQSLYQGDATRQAAQLNRDARVETANVAGQSRERVAEVTGQSRERVAETTANMRKEVQELANGGRLEDARIKAKAGMDAVTVRGTVELEKEKIRRESRKEVAEIAAQKEMTDDDWLVMGQFDTDEARMQYLNRLPAKKTAAPAASETKQKGAKKDYT